MNKNIIKANIEAQRAKYRRNRMRQDQELISDDITSIFEQTDDDLAYNERDTINCVMLSAYNQFYSRF